MHFLYTNDGLIGRDYIICIGKPEDWPHGVFRKVTYRVGSEAWETRARDDDVEDFLTENL